MNSLVSPTKIVTDEHVLHPMLANVAIPDKLPVACLPPPVSVIEEAIEVEEEDEGSTTMAVESIGTGTGTVDDEPMEEGGGNNGSPKQPSSLRSEDVIMAENVSVSIIKLIEGGF